MTDQTPAIKDSLEIDLYFNIGDHVRIKPSCARKVLMHNDWASSLPLEVLGVTVVMNEKLLAVNYMVQCVDRHHPAHADRKAYISEEHLYEIKKVNTDD
jgi:hypothetical protein